MLKINTPPQTMEKSYFYEVTELGNTSIEKLHPKAIAHPTELLQAEIFLPTLLPKENHQLFKKRIYEAQEVVVITSIAMEIRPM